MRLINSKPIHLFKEFRSPRIVIQGIYYATAHQTMQSICYLRRIKEERDRISGLRGLFYTMINCYNFVISDVRY